MIILKQLRNYFFTTGTTSDKQYLSGANKGKSKILKNNGIPDEDIFSQLLNSVPFVIDPTDTAFENQAGLVRKANDDCVIDRDDSQVTSDGTPQGSSTKNEDEANIYHTTAVLPHQIPEMEFESVTTPVGYTDANASDKVYSDGLILKTVERTKTADSKKRQIYKFALSLDTLPIVEADGSSAPEGYTDSEVDSWTSNYGINCTIYTRTKTATGEECTVFKIDLDQSTIRNWLLPDVISAGTFVSADEPAKTITFNAKGLITGVV